MTKKGEMTWSLLIGAIIVVLILVVVFFYSDGIIAALFDTNKCEKNVPGAECLEANTCVNDRKGVVYRHLNKACPGQSVCCVPDRDLSEIDPEIIGGLINGSENGSDTGAEAQTGPVRFFMELMPDKDQLQEFDTSRKYLVNKEYKFRTYGTGEHINKCLIQIWYSSDNPPADKPRLIKRFEVYECIEGSTISFKPDSSHATYGPVEVDVIAFNKDVEPKNKDDWQLTDWQRSTKYYLTIVSSEDAGLNDGESCDQHNECSSIKNADLCHECTTSDGTCYWHNRWWPIPDQCKSCSGVDACLDYNNEQACNDNSCTIETSGVGCAWAPISGGFCQVCNNYQNTNNCVDYLSKNTCEENPCTYGSIGCKWESGDCLERTADDENAPVDECEGIDICPAYNDKNTCNNNPCDVTSANGGDCTWSTYSGGYCHVCGDYQNTNNCGEYNDEATCQSNPCNYLSCEWSNNICS